MSANDNGNEFKDNYSVYENGKKKEGGRVPKLNNPPVEAGRSNSSWLSPATMEEWAAGKGTPDMKALAKAVHSIPNLRAAATGFLQMLEDSNGEAQKLNQQVFVGRLRLMDATEPHRYLPIPERPFHEILQKLGTPLLTLILQLGDTGAVAPVHSPLCRENPAMKVWEAFCRRLLDGYNMDKLTEVKFLLGLSGKMLEEAQKEPGDADEVFYGQMKAHHQLVELGGNMVAAEFAPVVIAVKLTDSSDGEETVLPLLLDTSPFCTVKAFRSNPLGMCRKEPYTIEDVKGWVEETVDFCQKVELGLRTRLATLNSSN